MANSISDLNPKTVEFIRKNSTKYPYDVFVNKVADRFGINRGGAHNWIELVTGITQGRGGSQT